MLDSLEQEEAGHSVFGFNSQRVIFPDQYVPRSLELAKRHSSPTTYERQWERLSPDEINLAGHFSSAWQEYIVRMN